MRRAGRGVQPRSPAARRARVADVILPIGLLPEIDATLTNLDGREQARRRRRQAAGRGACRLARAARARAANSARTGFEFTDLAGLRAGMHDARRRRSPRGKRAERRAAKAWKSRASIAIYRSDAVVRRAAGAAGASAQRSSPRAVLHPADATALGLADGVVAQVQHRRGHRDAAGRGQRQGRARHACGSKPATAPPRRSAPVACRRGGHERMIRSVPRLAAVVRQRSARSPGSC